MFDDNALHSQDEQCSFTQQSVAQMRIEHDDSSLANVRKDGSNIKVDNKAEPYSPDSSSDAEPGSCDSTSYQDELEDMLVRRHQQRDSQRAAARHVSHVASVPTVHGTGSMPVSSSEATNAFARIKWRQAPVVSHSSSCHAKVESGKTLVAAQQTRTHSHE